ncbi:MAG: phosphoribosyltransferase domain-containing protein [Candidatus Cloacimonetes bacterium]|nr:phosphoribosyltransferase domain-containing protein [Candidatus Cloacimonadota bacterium]
MKKEEISWDYYFKLMQKLTTIISVYAQEKFDLVVGISRGGLIPALLMSQTWDVSLDIIVTSSYNKENQQMQLKIGKPSYLCFPDINKDSKILIVDDLVDSGKTMQAVVDLYRKKGFKNIKTAVLIYKRSSEFDPDYFAAGADEDTWIKFPYEKER